MSTHILTVLGEWEQLSGINMAYDNLPAELNLTSFSGGQRRGRCIQITTNQHGGKGESSYIEMTRENVVLLRNALSVWLDGKETARGRTRRRFHSFIRSTIAFLEKLDE